MPAHLNARAVVLVALAAMLAMTLAGCGRGQRPIPAGAQQVHVGVAGSEVTLAPAIVHAGDVYLVLDTPGASVGFAQRLLDATDRPAPLTQSDIDRLARGDTEGTAIEGFDDFGCSAEQRAEDRGRMGPCGNVFQLVVDVGLYAFYTGDLEGRPPQDHPRPIAVLQVVP